jgi:phosphoglycolate phosphatase-like HAD superfamily hydrolase
MEKIQLIGFDLDGTLIDSFSESYNIDCRIIRRMGKIAPSINEYKTALAKCGTNWEQLYATFHVKDYKTAVDMYYDYLHDSSVKSIPGAKETLEEISSKNIPIFLSSINSKKESVLKKLKSCELNKYFLEDNIFVDPKSKIKSITRAYKETPACPSKVLFIGDTNIDIKDANIAGVCSVGISNDYSFHPSEYLKMENPHYPILNDITEVLDLI